MGFNTVSWVEGDVVKTPVLELSVSLPVCPLLILSCTRVSISLNQDHHLAGGISKICSSRKVHVLLLTLVL